MVPILLKAGSFVFLMILGCIFRKVGIFRQEDYKIPMKIVLNITLPAAIVTSFSSYRISGTLVFCALTGFLMNWLLLLLAILPSRKKARPQRAVWLNCTPGYNIGIFVLPFVQSFLTPGGVVACCLFDAGSAVMCAGGTYALSCGMMGDRQAMGLRQIGKKLLSSVPFLTYGVMLAWVLMGIPIPQVLLDFIHPAASANACLAMFMIGMMFDPKIKKGYGREIAAILALRLAGSAAAVSVCMLLPVAPDIRKALALALCAPVSVVSTALAERAGGDPALAACVNSLSIPVSLVTILALLALFGTL